MTVAAYPLSWPHGFPRANKRERGSFKTTLAGALKNHPDRPGGSHARMAELNVAQEAALLEVTR